MLYLQQKKTRLNRRNNQAGQALLGAVLLFLFLAFIIVFGISKAVFYQLKTATDFNTSRASYFLSEALAEDTTYRIMRNYLVGTSASLTLNGETATAIINNLSGSKEIISTGEWADLYRKTRVELTYGSGGSFFYGVQVGEGGLHMFNSSTIDGNVHSSGPVVGAGNFIGGDIVSAGATGLIDDMHASSSAYAHTIQDSTVGGDAFYTDLINTTVGGTSFPNSIDQPTSTLPISDAEIDEWESDANSGGSVTCTSGSYTIDSNITLGPKRIPCDLVIEGDPIVTLTGALWIEGDMSITNSAIIRISPAFIDVVTPIVVDNLSDRLNSSTIFLGQSVQFQGSGDNSYILLVSRNESAEQGGSVIAIDTQNSVNGDLLLYAPHGNIEMRNTVNLKEVTAYMITLRNSTQVTYESGLANILFNSGPSGGFEIVDWREVE